MSKKEEVKKKIGIVFLCLYLHLDGELAHGELSGVLEGAGSLAGLLALGESLAAALGELGAEGLGHGLRLLGVENLKGITFLLGEDGEDAGDVLAEDANLSNLGGGGLGLLSNAELRELLLGFAELGEEVVLRLGASVGDLEERRHYY